MTDGESLTNWLRLTLISGVGGQTQRKLLSAFGLPDAVFSAGSAALRAERESEAREEGAEREAEDDDGAPASRPPRGSHLKLVK